MMMINDEQAQVSQMKVVGEIFNFDRLVDSTMNMGISECFSMG